MLSGFSSYGHLQFQRREQELKKISDIIFFPFWGETMCYKTATTGI